MHNNMDSFLRNTIATGEYKFPQINLNRNLKQNLTDSLSQPIQIKHNALDMNTEYKFEPELVPKQKSSMIYDFTPNFTEQFDLESESLELALCVLNMTRSELYSVSLNELKLRKKIDMSKQSLLALNILIQYKQSLKKNDFAQHKMQNNSISPKNCVITPYKIDNFLSPKIYPECDLEQSKNNLISSKSSLISPYKMNNDLSSLSSSLSTSKIYPEC